MAAFSDAPMMVSDGIPGDDIPAGRPRLKLKKRTKPLPNRGAAPAASSGNSSIFGQARTREEILAAKGIDSSALEKRIAAKTQRLPRMSREEGETYDAIGQEIAFAKSELEKAETDEDKAKAQAEIDLKEQQRKDHVENIRKAQEAKLKAPREDGARGRPRFERPSERRRRLDQEGRGGGGNDLGASFSSTRRSGGYDGGGYGGGNDRNSNVRPGDWECQSCGANVFASKNNCFKCGAPRPDGAGGGGGGYGGGGGGGYGGGNDYGGGSGYAEVGGGGGGYGGDRGGYGGGGGGGRSYGSGYGGGGGGGGGYQDVRPGDWECPSCGANVFASKNNCFKCGTPRP